MSKDEIKDGLYLFYIKDEEIYPIAMDESNWNILQMMGNTIAGDPIRVVGDSMGKAKRYTGEDVL